MQNKVIAILQLIVLAFALVLGFLMDAYPVFTEAMFGVVGVGFFITGIWSSVLLLRK